MGRACVIHVTVPEKVHWASGGSGHATDADPLDASDGCYRGA